MLGEPIGLQGQGEGEQGDGAEWSGHGPQANAHKAGTLGREPEVEGVRGPYTLPPFSS